jgi:hypothetical protein
MAEIRHVNKRICLVAIEPDFPLIICFAATLFLWESIRPFPAEQISARRKYFYPNGSFVAFSKRRWCQADFWYS